MDYEHDTNLLELRTDLHRQLAYLLVGASAVVWWLLLIERPFPLGHSVFWALLFLSGLAVLGLYDKKPALACTVFLSLQTLGLVAGMYVFPDSWLPFLGIPLVCVHVVFLNHSQFITAAALLLAVYLFVEFDIRHYPSPDVYFALIAGTAFSTIFGNSLYRAIDWVWNLSRHTLELLELTRDRQEELTKTLRSLEQANENLLRTQQALSHARRQAEAAKRMKEQFAANISHEIRTPLNIITGFSEVLYLSPRVYGQMDWPPALRADIAHIYHNSTHLLQMVDDILDLSRYDMIDYSITTAPCSLDKLIENAVGIVKDLFDSKSLQLNLDVRQPLPGLEVDQTRIRQILLNLLTNALAFTSAGSVTITAEHDPANGVIIVSVSDTGIGIPDEEKPRIFEEFYQVDSSLSRQHQGSGLGLAISKRFVEAHGGRIWVESVNGQGATFRFTLPVDQTFPAPGLLVESEASGEPVPHLVMVYDPTGIITDTIENQIPFVDAIQIPDIHQIASVRENIWVFNPAVLIANLVTETERDTALDFGIPVIRCVVGDYDHVAQQIGVDFCFTKPVDPARIMSAIDQLPDVRSVLVLDDDRGFCQLVERILQTGEQPYAIFHAYDTARGLEIIHNARPDLLILDVVMGSNTGIRLLETIRQDPHNHDMKIIIISGADYLNAVQNDPGKTIALQHPSKLQRRDLTGYLTTVLDYLIESRSARLVASVRNESGEESPLDAHNRA